VFFCRAPLAYGTLKAVRLFWLLLSEKLQEWGFTINSYDACVANEVVDGKQHTMIWHVDDLNITHVDSKVVEHIIEMLEAEFGREAPLP
jgi:signal-transduction protein with cAMP-binding, CBS, and nucleotidyltransferase domain